jgi:hypothetical protein
VTARAAGADGWTAPAPDPVDGPTVGDDRAILQGYLDFQRRTLVNVCAGLSAAQLAARPLPSSELSLQGIVRHLAKVERVWLTQRAARHDVPALYGGPGDPTDFRAGRASDAPAELEQLRREWSAGDAAVAALPFDLAVRWRPSAAPADSEPEVWSLRMIYVHLIAEYARHNGHADLLREALDGVTGR